MRYLASEYPVILGKFGTGETVIISLYDLSDNSIVPLTSNVCTEISTTGVYKWTSANITTQPTSKTEYLWIMDDGKFTKQYGKLVLEGYIADILADTDELQSNQNNWITATGFATENPPSQNLDDYKADTTEIINILNSLAIDVTFIKDIEGGKWELTDTHMIFYKSDNTTEIARFAITKDSKNSPVMRERL